MALTDQEKAIAESTIGKWFWQPVEGKFFRYKFAVKNFVRYYECAPVAADTLRIIIEYLRTQEIPSDGKISLLNKQVGGFEGWKAKDAWYQTAASDQWEGTKSDKVRIYQTLCSPSEDSGDGDGPYTVENGCRYAVTHTFYWNVEELPELPASSSGINYTMQGLTRDQETGLYSCLIEKRERVEQDIPLYDTAKTIFETRQLAVFLGVKAEDLGSTGQFPYAAGGTMVERRLSKNEDCTTDVENVVTQEEPVSSAVTEFKKTLRGTVKTKTDRNQVSPLNGEGLKVGDTRRSEKTPGGLYNNTTQEKTTEAAGKIAEMCSKTIFEHEHQEIENVASEPDDASAAFAGGGKIHSKTHRQTEEGTWDVTSSTRQELPVSSAVTEFKKTLRGTVKTRTDRNQSSPLNGDGLKVGDTRRSEKTPGGLYNNTTQEKTTEAAGKIAAACVKYGGGVVHQHMTTENVASEPSDDSCSSAAANYLKQLQKRQTEEGTWNVERTVTIWTPQEESEDWSDANYTYHQVIYANKFTPMKPSSGDVVSNSFHFNGHGSYDGVYTVRNQKSAGSGETLQFSYGPMDCEAKYYYFNKQGKLCHRVVKGRVYKCYGKASHVADAIYGTASGTGGQAQNVAAVGWYTHMSMSGVANAHGTKYTAPASGDMIGPEVVDDDSEA